ncbi:phenylalanine--tRNA ligase subunit beta [Actinomarinicola tropica]|uniref:Phenylalanine--tRNA ligase beta subunit n=1 Tax=Actinomarinicola tropica TaxID=2789776 RepID=A0A5Q2RJW0_9ACTN|nr:phenylalanine--tRNA ligase subunit beta [Actinomarinicola tropica]QGG95202.1 phenylalanine--tRNA ligase subunit beta [Actinomarinicola tropica]
MKVLLSWLRDFAPFEGDPVALGEQLSDLGMAVESMDRLGEGLDGIVVARVLDLRPHPDADRIQLVDVDRGDGEALQIACGAFNMAVGDLVPLATIGTVMPGGMEIGRRKMRGEWSNGMLCSGRELGLGDDHSGILVLPSDAEPGQDVTAALGIESDVLYDLEINPNRPDAMSVAGVARDLAARLKLPFALPNPQVTTSDIRAEDRARVEIVDPDLCGRFVARVLHDVVVGESPAWLQRRLTALGMRPINSLVDVSNYVMLELGQPNHAYDLARLGGGGLRVRRARDGERLVTLDDVERRFTTDDLLICDLDDAPVGIAGVMGGASSEISEATTDVLLELAWFQPLSVARTSRRLGLRSEASARFEKGTDPEVLELAARRFAELLGADAGLADGVIDARGELPERPTVRVRTERVNEVIGDELVPVAIRDLLEPIGFAPTIAGTDDHDVTIPSWRPDCETEIDVIEEVARHHGYSRIPRRVPRSPISGGLSPRQRERREVRQALVGLGFTEVMPMPFLAPGDLSRAGLDDDGILVANPLVAEESVMRTSLLPGLCKVLAYNASHRNPDVAVFELGHVFNRPADPSATLPDERERVAAASGGADATAAVRTWRALAARFHVDHELVNADVPGLHPTRGATIHVDGQQVGVVGEIDPDVLGAFEVPGPVAYLDLDLTTLLALRHGPEAYRPVRLVPSSDLDLAFEVDEAVPAAALEPLLREAAGDLLVDLRLFDVFRGPSVADGRRSLAYRLRFQAADRTLTDADLAEVRARCIAAVESELPASLRG